MVSGIVFYQSFCVELEIVFPVQWAYAFAAISIIENPSKTRLYNETDSFGWLEVLLPSLCAKTKMVSACSHCSVCVSGQYRLAGLHLAPAPKANDHTKPLRATWNGGVLVGT